MGHIITFYSFKGGTGRSMALANVGCLLAQRIVSTNGKGVLLIDWDLEAPGLHRYFRDRLLNASGLRDEKTIDENPGLIDLFRIVDERFKKPTLSSNQETEESTRQVLEDDIDFEPFVLQTDISKLHVMKSGRFDNRYATTVNSFNWDEFYDRAPLFFQVFAQFVSERYDFVLVDSRTGFTDTSGICTTLLPNRLVVVFTPNRQSLTGVTGLIREATSYRGQSTDLRPLLVFPLVSRLEPTENTLRQYWRYGSKERGIVGYQGQFEQAFREIYDLPSCSLEDYFNEVLVQHVPSFSYGEDIAVLDEQRGDGLALTRRYECLVEYLLKPSGPWVSRDKRDAAHVAERQKLPQLNLEGATPCPYPGLAAFSETEAAFFFGREIAIDRLLQRLRPMPRLLAFLGPSGSGKTSLIRAGLVPRLKAGALPSSDRWKILMLRVSESSFSEVGEERSSELWKDLAGSIEHLLRAEPEYARVLLVIDQCEEIFSESPEARALFETQIAKLLSASVPCTVLISLRDVFYSQFTQQFPGVVPWLEEGLVNLPQTLNRAELATIAAEPAHTMGVVFEERLLDTIVNDAITAAPGPQASTASAQTSILPLLQFCLFQLWSTRSEGYLSLAAYISNGGLAGALVNKADEAISVLRPIDAAIARRVLTGLVYQPEDWQGTGFVRRRRLLSDFGSDGEGRESITRVVKHLSDYRLVVIGVDGGHETVQLAHEAFIRYWPRLRGWLQEDRQILLWTQRVLTRAGEWNEAGRDAGFLLRGGQLEEAKFYLTTKGQQYSSSLAQEFIQASLQSRRRRRLLLIGAPLVVVLVITALTSYAWRQTTLAESQERMAEEIANQAERQNTYNLIQIASERASRICRELEIVELKRKGLGLAGQIDSARMDALKKQIEDLNKDIAEATAAYGELIAQLASLNSDAVNREFENYAQWLANKSSFAQIPPTRMMKRHYERYRVGERSVNVSMMKKDCEVSKGA